MIGTNLSTRPFYNVRAVRVALGMVALLIAVLTALHVARFVSLRGSEAALSTRATDALNEAGRLRAEALRIQAQVDPRELQAVAVAAQDANAVIERRAFSWTGFLSQIEATLPAGVRVTSVQPFIDDGAVRVSLVVEARRARDLAAFMDALEDEGTFRRVLPSEERVADDGIIDAVIQAIYVPPELGSPPDDGGGSVNGDQP